MAMQLRDYQQEAVNAIFQYYADGNTGNPIVCAATGAGKSLIIGEFIKQVQQLYPGENIIMATHVADLVSQNFQKVIAQWQEAPVGIYSAGLGKKQPWAAIVCGGIQSMYKKAHQFGYRAFILVDECFTGETEIMTNKGLKRIDKVGCGDIVYTATGFAEVIAKSTKIANVIYKVRLSNGREFRVTGNHPILSSTGWTEVRNLAVGSEVFGIQDMPQLWKTLSTSANSKIYNEQNVLCKESVLLNLLLKEAGKCNVVAGYKGKDGQNITKNWTQAISAWWQWAKINQTANDDARDDGQQLDCGTSNKHKSRAWEWCLSQLLQSGLRQSNDSSCDRTRWGITPRETEAIGREKGQILGNTWVESIEIEKSTSGEFVYNLQTDGHPSYFANGILVHNCQLLSPDAEGMYMKFIDELKKINPNLKVVGFSATPWREKGGSLVDQKNAIFTDIIYDISLGYLVKRGYLTGLISKSSLIQADLSGVKVFAGEYNLKQAEAVFDRDELTKAAIAEVEVLANDRKHFLFFCSGVNHSFHVRDELRSRGWDADVITGETPQAERNAYLTKFKTSKTRYALVNNAVLTTGTDLPNADCLVLLRATKSTVLYIQICGRGARPVYATGFDLSTDVSRLAAIAAGSKPTCLVLDYGTNIERFGAVDLIEMPKRKKKGVLDALKPTSPPQKICPSCREPIHISIMECKCGYIFPDSEKPQHEQSASNAAIMSTEIKPERFTVARVIYKPHVGASGIPSLRVQYYSSFGFIGTEYVCFSHVGFARRKAEDWCVMRDMAGDLPKDTDEAYFMSENFKTPVAIFAKKSGKYMEIVGYEF